MEGMGEYGIDTRAGLSFLEKSGANNSVSKLILSNNLLYSLYSFVWELVHLGKSPSSKMAGVEWKMIFPCIWCIKQYPLSSYPMNIINSEYGMSLLAQTPIGRNT